LLDFPYHPMTGGVVDFFEEFLAPRHAQCTWSSHSPFIEMTKPKVDKSVVLASVLDLDPCIEFRVDLMEPVLIRRR